MRNDVCNMFYWEMIEIAKMSIVKEVEHWKCFAENCAISHSVGRKIKQTNSSRIVFSVVLWSITHCVRTWNFSIKISRKEILVIHTEMRVQQQQQRSKNQIDAEKCIIIHVTYIAKTTHNILEHCFEKREEKKK